MSTVRAGVDTWIWSAKPKKNFHRTPRLRVASGTRKAFVRFKSPAPKNATIASASLVFKQAADASGSYTLTAQRVAARTNVDTLAWDDNPVGVGPTATLTKSGPGADTVWELDVTDILQDVSNGEPFFGFLITSSNTDELQLYALNASKHRPYLDVTWTTRPETPTLLKPSYGAVSVAKPILTCDYTDHSGSTDLTAIQVQIDAANNFTSGVDWDSGTVLVDTPQLDLSTTSYPGLAAGDTTFWRVRVRDGDGLWSSWSDSVPLSRQAKGVLSIVSPGAAPNDYVSEFTPPIVWSFTGGTQTHFRVKIAPASDPKKLLHDSGKIRSTASSYTLPKKVLRDDRNYRVTVQIWDLANREGIPGDPVYVHTERDFHMNYDATVNAPTALLVAQDGIRPWVDVTIAIGTAPDTFTIIRDGVAIETDVEPGDLTVGPLIGGVQSYIWRDWTARPGLAQTYRARAEVNGKLSTGGPTATITPVAEGLWLADPDTGQEVLLGGTDFDTSQDDNAETFMVLGTTAVVRSVMGLNGLEGSVTGATLMARDGFDWDDLEATLYDFKGRPADEFRLVLSDINIPVVLGNLKIAPSPASFTGQIQKAVTFVWWQTDEHPFEVHV